MSEHLQPQPESLRQHLPYEYERLEPGQATTFEPRPFEDEVPVIDIVKPIVGVIEAGEDRFYLTGESYDGQTGVANKISVIHTALTNYTNYHGEMVFSPRAAVGVIDQDNPHLVIGRAMAEEQGVVGVSSAMSRAHASLDLTQSGTIRVKDLASTNGTGVVFGEPLKLELADHKTESLKLLAEVGQAERPLKGEDVTLNVPEEGIFGVFDGAGGHEGGQLAAQIAADAFHDSLAISLQADGGTLQPEAWQVSELVKRALTYASQEVLETEGAGITTGAVAKVVDEVDGSKSLVWGVVGDSRIYKYSRTTKSIMQLGRDEGEGKILDNALGTDNCRVQQVGVEKLAEGDEIIICSDGITGDKGNEIMSIEEVFGLIDKATSPQAAARNLLDASRKRDDKSVLVIKP